MIYDYDDIEFEVLMNTKMSMNDFNEKMSSYDAVVFQRVGSLRTVEVMKSLKSLGIKVYMDIDDNLFDIAPTSPAYKTWQKGGMPLDAFTQALAVADCVFVSTPELIDVYKNHASRFEVFMNGIDLDRYIFNDSTSRRKEFDADNTVVMWTGSSTHLDSLKVICEELRMTFNSRPKSLFALCSNPEFLKLFKLRQEQKRYVPHVHIDQYYNVPSIADIGLAPVVLNQFNDAKSELKCLEYGVWGVPTICSAAAPYTRFHEISGGANIVVEKNSPQKWRDSVALLIDNPELRKELGQKSKKAVEEHYNLSVLNEKRYNFFKNELK